MKDLCKNREFVLTWSRCDLNRPLVLGRRWRLSMRSDYNPCTKRWSASVELWRGGVEVVGVGGGASTGEAFTEAMKHLLHEVRTIHSFVQSDFVIRPTSCLGDDPKIEDIDCKDEGERKRIFEMCSQRKYWTIVPFGVNSWDYQYLVDSDKDDLIEAVENYRLFPKILVR